MTRLRTLLREAWVIARPYWFSDDRWAGRGLLLVVVGLTLGLVYINVLLNRWNNTFYNALQDRNYAVYLAKDSGSGGGRARFTINKSTGVVHQVGIEE